MATKNIFKRCGCRHPETKRPYGSACPRLRRPNGTWDAHHGGWFFQIELPAPTKTQRRQLKRGPFPTSTDAQTELDHARRLLALADRDPDQLLQISNLLHALDNNQALPEEATIRRLLFHGPEVIANPLLADYLTDWLRHLDVTDAMAGSTMRTYDGIIRFHLIPHLGHVRLAKLRPAHVRHLIEAILERNTAIVAGRASTDPAVRKQYAGIRPTGPATRHRIRGVLRAALNQALTDGLVDINAAVHVATPEPRALPLVWTDERVTHWQATGEVPGPVMVWTAEQARAFLAYAETHAPDLYALFHFATYRGARRGEVCGLLKAEVRARDKALTINNQITRGRTGFIQKPPKSRTSNRIVYYDTDTSSVLTHYNAMKAQWKLAAGEAWTDSGLYFVRPDGTAWNPNSVSQRFRRLTQRAGLPPIRFHDLRHVAATLALAAGVDIKVVQELLGHTTATLTRDTYTSVIEALHRDAAEAVATTLRTAS